MGGAARPTTSRITREADPTEGITRKGKPHEPRGGDGGKAATTSHANGNAPRRIPRR